jgi:hypothetical protein
LDISKEQPKKIKQEKIDKKENYLELSRRCERCRKLIRLS